MKKSKWSFITKNLVLISIIVFTLASVNLVGAASVPTIKGQAYVESRGWLSAVTAGKTCGTVNKSLRLEGLKITLVGKYKNYIRYRAHVADNGWQGWKKSGELAGTTGKAKAIEAVQIKLTGKCAKLYDIYYRVHVPYLGWLGWAKNGATAGSTLMSLRTEAIQFKLVKKNSPFSTGVAAEIKNPTCTYKAHSETYGWGDEVSVGETAGTTGKSKRLEAFVVNFKNFFGGNGVKYRAHVADIGWQDWVKSGEVAGTVGKGKQIEGIQIKLDGVMENFYDIYYKLYLQNKGWLGWAKNGELAGSTGKGIRAEALRITIMPKGYPFNVGGKPSL